MYLKYASKKDLESLRIKYAKEIDYLPLKNEDSTYKNFIIYDYVTNSNFTKNKFIDCGSGPSPLAWLLCDSFKEGYMIDLSVKNSFNKENLYHNLGDFFSYMEKHEDNSIDFALDGCSVTHFEYDSNSNTGLRKTAKTLSKKLKKNGFFVMASDVISHITNENLIQTEFVKVTDIITIFESEGFELLGNFDYSSIEDSLQITIDYHNRGNLTLHYCNLIFKKK